MKLKYYFPTSLEHLYRIIMVYIALFCLVILVMAGVANAGSDLVLPNSYSDNQCEKIAKDFQNAYGGSLVWIQPLKENGAYDLGEYNAHIINRVYQPTYPGSYGKVFFYDYYTGSIMFSKQEVMEWYTRTTGKQAEVFVLSEERPPFSMIWHY